MFWKFPLKVQAYSSKVNDWYTKEFQTKKELTEYIYAQFKVPGEYELRNTKKWKETGQYYTDTVSKPNFQGGRYTDFRKGTAKFNKWRDIEKDRVLNGVIYDGWYIPPFYYWYLNFCPIYDDLLQENRFGDVWDSDFWYMQYVMLAILQGKHVGGVKGRQKGYSFKHMAILYWSYSWFTMSVNTVGGFDEKLVKKSWRFLEFYRDHINTYTSWRRGPMIPKALEWNEIQLDANGKPQGNKSILKGVTFKQSPENDVGGSQTFFNYEEPGVSPTLLQTLEFVRPALEKGSVTTGTIIACGSVGNLDDAEGIKTIFYNPEDNNFLGVKNIWDKAPKREKSCKFISEAYNMIGADDDPDDPEATGRPFMDADGNSDVKLALSWIARKAERIKNSTKKAELKQLALSQKCISPEQAFAQRNLSEFPVEQLRKQQERIKLKWEKDLWEYKPQRGLLEEKEGKIILNKAPIGGLPPEHEYPIKPEWEDKRGVWTIYEPPDDKCEMFTYFSGVDPIEVDVTDTSESVASCDIYKTAIEVTYTAEDGKTKQRIEGDKLVASYRGRFDTPNKTNEQIWMGIKMYNAWTYAERNKPNFINYMRTMGRAERYLAKESDVPLFKDMNIKSGNVVNNSKFGFHKGDNTEVWKHFKAYAKEYFMTEYGRNENDQGEVTKIFTGIDRIDDYWLLEEFCLFLEGDKKNYDRLISFMAALFIAKIYQQNRIIKRRSEVKVDPNKEKRQVQRPVVNLLTGGMTTNTNIKRKKPFSMI